MCTVVLEGVVSRNHSCTNKALIPRGLQQQHTDTMRTPTGRGMQQQHSTVTSLRSAAVHENI